MTLSVSRVQAIALVVLRTLIGWHFLYEGYYKLLVPGWSRAGVPLGRWSARAYLEASTGPLAPWFRELAGSWIGPWIDLAVPIALVLTGLSLLLGLFTELGAWSALALLALFYASAIPIAGLPAAGAEGTYLFVNKTLIEAGAVVVLLAFRTGRLAGLDRLRRQAPAASSGK